MARDFMKMFGHPVSLARALRKLTLGSVIAVTGLPVATPAAGPNETPLEGAPSAGATIVNRSKKAGKLILQLPGSTAYVSTEHRSHRSHSSHRSHYSSVGGTTTTAPRPTPPPTSPNTVVAANAVSGEIETIDKVRRTFVVKLASGVKRTFGFRDDTKHTTNAGVTFRFDELSNAADAPLPISIGDKVKVQWRVATDGSHIATTIRQTGVQNP